MGEMTSDIADEAEYATRVTSLTLIKCRCLKDYVMPISLTELNLSAGYLTNRQVTGMCLPKGLQRLDVSNNRLGPELPWILPDGIKHLSIGGNYFHIHELLHQLPKGLQELIINYPRYYQEPHPNQVWSVAHCQLHHLSLRGHRLTDQHWSNWYLPSDSLTSLDIDDNYLSGPIKIPSTVQVLHLGSTRGWPDPLSPELRMVY